jgi:hypothetical protein
MYQMKGENLEGPNSWLSIGYIFNSGSLLLFIKDYHYYFFLVVLGFELRASHLLSHAPSPFYSVILVIGSFFSAQVA